MVSPQTDQKKYVGRVVAHETPRDQSGPWSRMNRGRERYRIIRIENRSLGNNCSKGAFEAKDRNGPIAINDNTLERREEGLGVCLGFARPSDVQRPMVA